MLILFSIGIVIFCLISAFIMPWVNRRIVHSLQEETGQLKTIVQELILLLEREKIIIPNKLKPKQSTHTEQENANSPKEDINKQPIDKQPSKKETEVKTLKPKPIISFEQQLGTRFPVWAGGIAITLAGFFLVKYSIDNQLLSPIIRIILGCLLGGGLLFTSHLVHKKPNFANGVRIAQSLSGAGIAVLYISLYVATSRYQLIPDIFGFLAIGAITILTVVLALRHGPPIALLGLIGGFLTPALIESNDPSAPIQFIYLYFVFSVIMAVIKRKNWWILSIPALIGAFLWIILWIINSFTSDDTIWLSLFLIALSVTIITSSRHIYEKSSKSISGTFKITLLFNYIGIAGIVILMGIVTSASGFNLLDWSFFGILTLGGISLAYFNDKLYGFIPLASMVVNASMLTAWTVYDANIFALTLIIFGSIYIAAGYFLIWSANLPLLWAGLAGTTSVIFYLIAYFKLYHTNIADYISLFWGLTALAFAGLAICALQEIRNHYSNNQHKEYLLAIFAITATTFISIGFAIELETEFLSVAIASEMLAISWINIRIPIKALRPIIMLLALIYGLLLAPQIMLFLQLTFYSLTETKILWQENIPLVQWPIFQLGVPALMFIGTSYFLCLNRDGRLVQALELSAVGLITLTLYYLARHIFHVDSDIIFYKAEFFERSVITNILFMYGITCFLISRYLKRISFSWSGILLCTVALFRIIYFDLLKYNPLLTNQKIDGWPILNTLLLPYGLPLIWAWLTSKELSFIKKEKWAKYFKGFILPLLFALVNLNIRYYFHGEYLYIGITTNAESYSYSMAWLLLGICLLLAGVIKHSKMLRHASLGVIALTVGKVFLYDSSELEGLYRVFSFFGLGLSLLGLSWLYTRFIFSNHNLKVTQRPD